MTRVFPVILCAMAVTAGGVRLAGSSSEGFLILAAGCVAAAFALARIARFLVSQPLEGIIAALHEGVRHGHLPFDLPENFRVPEVRRLAHAVNCLSRSVRHSRTQLDAAYVQFLETMAQALDARDPYTAGHSLRVAAYSFAIAREMGVPQKESEMIRTAAQLHDIGKIGIPDLILQKAGRLTPEEFGLIKVHPQIGRKILEKVIGFGDLLPIVELHHENFDGTGYPYKLSGTRIPMAARIVRVADAFDSMTSSRSYRNAMPVTKAIDELVKYSGTHFDPQVTQTFLNLIARGQPEILIDEQDGLIPRPKKVPVWLTA
jgi:putative nucleotidyltransferase with HDIG domain